MRARNLLAIAGAGALILAACGSSGGSVQGSGHDSTTSSTTASRSQTSETSSPAALVRAQRRAHASLLVQSDFPPGWTSSPHVEDQTPSNPAASKQLADCFGVPDTDVNGSHDIHGPDFALGEKFQVMDDASVITSPAEATRMLHAINGPKFIPCYQPVVTNLIRADLAKSAPNANLGKVTLRRLDLPHYGDATVGFEVAAPVSGPKGTVTVYLDAVLVRSGLAGLGDMFLGLGQPVDHTLERHVLDNATDRLTGKQPPTSTSAV